MGEKSYKGFCPGMVCKGKKYTENTVFEEPKAEVCESGMHYCNNPFEVLNHYPLINDNGEFNEFAEVEDLAEPKTDDNKKFCTTKLRIGAKLSFSGFIKACVNFVIDHTKFDFPESNICSGDCARIGSSGNYARIGSSGNYARIGSSGDSARIGSSGNSARIGSSGNYTRIGSTGYSAQIGSSGDCAQIGSSGYSAQIGSSGDCARIGSSGYSAQIGSSGDCARIGSSGYSAQIGSSGNCARIGSSGEDSVICCAGHDCRAKAKKGSWITLSEWRYDNGKERIVPACVKTEYVDGERIKEDTYYKLENGEFVEMEE